MFQWLRTMEVENPVANICYATILYGEIFL